MTTSMNQKWFVLIGISIASFLGCVDFTIVNTALPVIQSSLHATVTQLQWIINIFILVLSALMVIMGRLADIYGRRLVLYFGMIVFGLASLMAGFAPTIHWLIAARLFQGASVAILYTATGAIVANAFPANEKGKAMGALFGINGIGLAIGPVIGGIFVSTLGWRWIFLINVPLIIISLLICAFNVKESRLDEKPEKIDWYGLVFLLIALPTLILGIAQGASWGWLSISTLSCFIISFIAFVMFCLIELKAAFPIVELHLFRNRNFIASVIATAALGFFYCLAFFLMPLYLSHIQQFAGYKIGLALLPTTATVAILSPVVGHVVDKLGTKLILLVGFSFFILSAFLQTFFTTDTTLWFIVTAFVAMGIGWACILGPATVASLSAVKENMAGLALGTAWTLHNIGAALGLAIGTVVYHYYAQLKITADLVQQQIMPGKWLTTIIANPNLAINLLQHFANLSVPVATTLFQNSFLRGYHAGMWLLVCSSFIALIAILLLMKITKIKPQKKVIQNEIPI